LPKNCSSPPSSCIELYEITLDGVRLRFAHARRSYQHNKSISQPTQTPCLSLHCLFSQSMP
jgi:hypothetical protein